MHAFMALFFYELIRDQIVFIWHAWAVVVVHGPPLLAAGPCLQDFWWPGAKRKEKQKQRSSCRVQVMSKTDFKRLFIHWSLCIYLFVPFDSRSELYGRRRSVWSATSCYHFSKKKRQKNTDLTPPETDFTRQLFRNCSNTKALRIFLLILLDVSEENWWFFSPFPHFFFELSKQKLKKVKANTCNGSDYAITAEDLPLGTEVAANLYRVSRCGTCPPSEHSPFLADRAPILFKWVPSTAKVQWKLHYLIKS